MKPPIFEHHLPSTLQEALRDLRDLENSRLLAGGQSLMPMLNFRLIYPDHLIDLNGIEDLAYIKKDGEEILIGAMTVQRAIEYSEVIKVHLPLLSDAILSVGHRQTRNRGTIGGSLCHLDPAAELPLIATALEATVVVAGIDRLRMVPMAEFAEDIMTPAIEQDEIVSEIRFKPWPEGHGWAFAEYSRRKGDFAIVAAAALLNLQADGRIDRASLTLGGVGPVPVPVRAAEEELVGHMPDTGLFSRAAAHCAAIEPLDDPFAPAWYRRKLSVPMAQRVLAESWARACKAKRA